MARYSNVLRKMWDDQRFRALSSPDPNAQTLWFRLLTGPEIGPIPGVIPARAGGLAEALKWPKEGFLECFRELSTTKPEAMAVADWDAGLIWVPKAIVHNGPTNPNVVKSWRDYWDDVPECPLKVLAYQRLKLLVEPRGESFRIAFEESVRNPSRNQEQEQEQEQEGGGLADGSPQGPDQLELTSPKPKKRKRSSTLKGETANEIGWRVFKELWEARHGAEYPTGPPDGRAMMQVSKAAKAHATTRVTETSDHEGRRRVTEEVMRHWVAAYLADPGNRNWLADRRHPLPNLDRDIAKYGLPWSTASAAPASETSDRPELQKIG